MELDLNDKLKILLLLATRILTGLLNNDCFCKICIKQPSNGNIALKAYK